MKCWPNKPHISIGWQNLKLMIVILEKNFKLLTKQLYINKCCPVWQHRIWIISYYVLLDNVAFVSYYINDHHYWKKSQIMLINCKQLYINRYYTIWQRRISIISHYMYYYYLAMSHLYHITLIIIIAKYVKYLWNKLANLLQFVVLDYINVTGVSKNFLL